MNLEAQNILRLVEVEDAYLPKIRTAVRKDVEDFLSELAKNESILRSGDWQPAANETLIQQTYELFMRSYLEGMADAGGAAKDMADAVPQPLQFDEAIAFAKSKLTLAKSDYKKLSDQMRYRAWTVGRLTQVDAIDKVRGHYLSQLEGESSSLGEFIKSIKADDALTAAGFGEESPWYYETVYRTNIMTDYNAGRAQAFTSNQPVALEFIGLEDSRQTSICAARSGVILPYTDPWWETNWPPLHYNCRSTIRSIYREEAEEIGLDVKALQSKGAPDSARVQPSGGFGKNPIMDNEFWAPTTAQQGRINKALIQEELNGVAGETVCADFKVPREGWQIVETGHGGLRYPAPLEKEKEFAKNLHVGKALAEKGYFVELRMPDKKLLFNRYADAYVNATELWEFKVLTSDAVNTMSKRIAEAATQAQRLCFELTSADQAEKLAKAIASRIPALKAKGRQIANFIILYKKHLVALSWSDLQDADTVMRALTTITD